MGLLKKDIYKFAQSCSSRECKKNNRNQYEIKNGMDATTTHVLDKNTKKVKCLYCGKESKIG